MERKRLGETLTAADVHLISLRPTVAGLLVPSKIYGILAAGRPTIYVGPEASEVASLLREGGCGSIVRNGDVDGLVAAVSAYDSDHERRDREGRNARTLLERRFALRNSVQAFRAILERIAGDQAR